MAPGDLDEGGMISPFDPDLDIKDVPGPRGGDGDGGIPQVVRHTGHLLLRDGGEDLQLPPGIAGHDPRHCRRGNAPQAAGVGDHHTLHVFDNVGADLNVHGLGQRPQGPPGQGPGVGHGDGLRTAHGRHQLLLQDLHIGAVQCFFHIGSSLFSQCVDGIDVLTAGVELVPRANDAHTAVRNEPFSKGLISAPNFFKKVFLTAQALQGRIRLNAQRCSLRQLL